MKTLITKTVLGAVGVALVALALQVSPAAADHRHADRRDDGYRLPIARHDHGYPKRIYGRNGELRHSHSGYGRHIHVSPYADHRRNDHYGRKSGRYDHGAQHRGRKHVDHKHRDLGRHDHKHSHRADKHDDHKHARNPHKKSKDLRKAKKLIKLFSKFRKH